MHDKPIEMGHSQPPDKEKSGPKTCVDMLCRSNTIDLNVQDPIPPRHGSCRTANTAGQKDKRKEHLEEFYQKHQELDNTKRQLEQEKMQLQNEMETLHSDLQRLRIQNERLVTAITVHVDEKEKALVKAEKDKMEVERQTDELQNLKEHVKALRKRAMKFQTVEAFRTVVSRTLRSKLEEIQRSKEAVSAELKTSHILCQAQQVNLTDALNQNQSLRTALSHDKEKYESEAYKLNRCISELNHQLEVSKEDVLSRTMERDDARETCNTLTNELEAVNEQKMQWDQDRVKMTEQVRNMETEKERLATNCKVLEMQKKTAEEQSVAYGQQQAVLHSQNTYLQKICAEKESLLNECNAAYSSQLHTLRDEARKKDEKVFPLEIAAQRATREKEDLIIQLNEIKTAKEHADKRICEMREEVERATSALEVVRRSETKLREEINEKETGKLRVCRENLIARQHVATLQEENRRLRLRLP